MEGKLFAIVNLVTQLAVNQMPTSVARVCGIRSSNDHHASVCAFSQPFGVDEHPEAYALQTPIAETITSKRDKAHDREDGSLLLEQFSGRNDAILIGRVHEVATDTSAETRKLEAKLDALVNLVTQLAANQKPASVARVCAIRSSNDYYSRQFCARNDAIVIRGVHDVATDTSAKTRKLEGKLDAVVNLVTQLATNQKPASVTRVCGICSSNNHHTSVCPSSQQAGVDKPPEAYVADTYSRPP
ncbi:hypothetical protein Fmac_032833 [Flemingia macrophylla]|uniref:Uncharacterized protein n=1 Tax=Flemingia macrophylla TaxID=520843 RepID=A0ABD1L632_9FABA